MVEDVELGKLIRFVKEFRANYLVKLMEELGPVEDEASAVNRILKRVSMRVEEDLLPDARLERGPRVSLENPGMSNVEQLVVGSMMDGLTDDEISRSLRGKFPEHEILSEIESCRVIVEFIRVIQNEPDGMDSPLLEAKLQAMVRRYLDEGNF